MKIEKLVKMKIEILVKKKIENLVKNERKNEEYIKIEYIDFRSDMDMKPFFRGQTRIKWISPINQSIKP